MQTESHLTLYSRSVKDNVEQWERSIIHNVHWENREAVNVLMSGLSSANSVHVYIPMANRKQPIIIKSGDIVVRGIVTKEISKTYRIRNLREDYSEVVRVTSIDKYNYGDPRMHHLEIGAARWHQNQ